MRFASDSPLEGHGFEPFIEQREVDEAEHPGCRSTKRRTAGARPSPNTPSTASTPPPERGKVLPMCPVRSVTYVSGRSRPNRGRRGAQPQCAGAPGRGGLCGVDRRRRDPFDCVVKSCNPPSAALTSRSRRRLEALATAKMGPGVRHPGPCRHNLEVAGPVANTSSRGFYFTTPGHNI